MIFGRKAERILLNRIINGILNSLYPRRCPLCHEILKNQDSVICERCAGSLKSIQEPRCFKCGKPVAEGAEYCPDCQKTRHAFDQGRGIFVYDEKMRRSMVRYKYYGCREYGDFYSRAMCRYAGKELRLWNPDVIVPVPIHKSKERMRGFNQSAYLAVRISGYTGIPADLTLVKKVENTKSQKKLSAWERHENLKKAFLVQRPVRGMRILVVDDVYTTGSTMDAMARCLKEKGAEKVYFLTLCIGKR